ncbi:MAG: chemotaxis protein CheC [Defluviitaleaceae bacterium]|nr:chemotaxis protein CheC [Defluviitaleaceae bacterium]
MGKEIEKKDFQLEDNHINALQEISNIGAGNALTALCKLLHRNIVMSLPSISLVDFKEASDFLGGSEKVMLGILSNVHSDHVDGIIMFLLDLNHAKTLICSVLGREFSEDFELGELELSAITEVGNILNSSYLNAISALLDERLVSSIPHVSIDMAAAILSVPAIEFGKVSDESLLIKNTFELEEKNIDGYFLFVPDVDSFKFVFSSLGLS